MKDSAHIRCPNCEHSIDVSAVLYAQLQVELKDQFKEKYSKQQKTLEQSQQQLLEKERQLDEQVQHQVKEQLAHRQHVLENQLKERFSQESELKLKSLESELSHKSETVKELYKKQVDSEREKREYEENQLKFQIQMERQLSQTLVSERERLRKEESDKAQMKLSEKDQIIEQLRQQAQEAQRKAEQGSMQLQGEVQELAIENWLRENFPLDTIEEVKKGVRGADCVQVVNSRSRQNIGKIYYESKRTKAFQVAWIEKLKKDMQHQQASVGILVTETLPKEITRVGQLSGIWICTFDDLASLVGVIRESIIQIDRALVANQDKGDKMSLLYAYLTGQEFRLQIESMVEGFVQMKEDLDREKRAMESLWKKREKQIEKVLFNANQFYSSIRGIAGNAVPEVRQFELPREFMEE